MNKSNNKDMFWQQIRGATILAVIFIHCQSAIDSPLNSINGFSYYLIRNIVNFPVDMFFFMSGFFMKPVDDVKAFYKKRLPKLIVPYLFYTFAYLVMRFVFDGNLGCKKIIISIFFGTAVVPLYYIIVLMYFTLLAPLLQKALHNKGISIIIFLSTPVCILLAYAIRFIGTDIWIYLKYTPVWLSFYYLGMVIREYKPVFKKSVLWILLLVSFIIELVSTALLLNIEGFNAYTQLRFAGAFYSVIIILLVYEYSNKTDRKNSFKWLNLIGDDSYAIYYMHYAFMLLFPKIIPFSTNTIQLLYQLVEIGFAVSMCELIIFIIKKVIKNKKARLIFGV